jgi:DNA-binding NarL/FixJ family response regulator
VIAEAIALSSETVKDNIASMMGKLGAHNRTEAASIYGQWLERQRGA